MHGEMELLEVWNLVLMTYTPEKSSISITFLKLKF